MIENYWGTAAVWMGLALLASLIAIRFNLSVALVEILVGIAAGNLALLLDQHRVFGLRWALEANEGLKFLAAFGGIMLTFMAGAEIRPAILRRFLKESLAIGAVSFAVPFVTALTYAHYISGWNWHAALICGAALSTTSVAVVYAVMIETGLSETEFGKVLLAACFITDLGTVIALGACFSSYSRSLVFFASVGVVVIWLARPFVGWLFARMPADVSEPGVKMVFFALFGLGALAAHSNSEAVLPAYMVALALAGVFADQRELIHRLRTAGFALLTPFYFINAGMRVDVTAAAASLHLILILFFIKLITKWVGVWPLAQWFRFGFREGSYATLLMSTGLTFGTISASFGLTHGYLDGDGAFHTYINHEQYSILVAVVIGSAIIPAMIAQRFFQPEIGPAMALGPDSPAQAGNVPRSSAAPTVTPSAPESREHDWRWKSWWH